MTKLSLGDAWEGASAFLGREWKLLLPVSLAFVGVPGLVAQMLAPKVDPAHLDAAASVALLPWLLGMSLIGLLGQLATNVLVLVPGVSVGEALVRAANRFPILLVALILAISAASAGMIVLAMLFSVGGKTGATLGAGLGMAAGGVLALRLMMTHVVVVAESVGPWDALKRSWRLTGEHAFKLLGFCIVAFLAMAAISVVVAAVGSVLRILDALGGPDLSTLVIGLLGALANSVTTMVFTVVTAFLYRQLSGSSSGT